MLHDGSVGASLELNKRNLTLTLDLLLPSIAFYNKICDFVMSFMELSFLRFIHGLNFVLSLEFCKISKNTFFTKHLWATASAFSLSKHGVVL